jgi:hypothetical protein
MGRSPGSRRVVPRASGLDAWEFDDDCPAGVPVAFDDVVRPSAYEVPPPYGSRVTRTRERYSANYVASPVSCTSAITYAVMDGPCSVRSGLKINGYPVGAQSHDRRLLRGVRDGCRQPRSFAVAFATSRTARAPTPMRT